MLQNHYCLYTIVCSGGITESTTSVSTTVGTTVGITDTESGNMQQQDSTMLIGNASSYNANAFACDG